MERTLLQRKIIYGLIGGIKGALFMVPALLFFGLPQLLFSLSVPLAILALLGPPVLMGLFSARDAEVAYEPRKWSFVLRRSISHFMLVTLGVTVFSYLFVSLFLGE